MRYFKHLLVFILVISTFNSCEKEKEVSYALQDVSAPTNIAASFNLAQDNTGAVSVMPSADGVTVFNVYFGDIADETATEVSPGETASHVYGEGEFTLKIIAVGLTGLKSELSRIVTISFDAPTELAANAIVSSANPYEINVTPTATGATVYDVYFGDVDNEEPTTIMNGETAMHTYAEAGDYNVRVVARGAGEASIESIVMVSIQAPVSFNISDFEGTWVLASEAGSFGVGPTPGDISWFAIDDAGVTARACYFDDTYTFGSDGSFVNNLGTESWIETWQGGSEACGTPVAPHDGSVNATYTIDGTAGTVTINGTGAYIGLAKAVNEGEVPTVTVPESITYTISFSEDKNTMNVVIESGSGVFWQYKLIKDTQTPPPSLEGTWRMASEAGSLGVGPAIGDISWFAVDDAGVADRVCYYDDTYVFGGDGSFMNILGTDTWVEGWQGGSDACGAPVAPHDGSTSATYSYDANTGTLTINGAGAYVGIPKAVNAGELPGVAVPTSITYSITLSDNNNTMNVAVESGAGVFWQYKLIKDEAVTPPIIAGTWVMASEVGSLGVGPTIGDTSWFSVDAAGVTDRACYYDDTYVFGNTDSFMNVLGADTWVEGWQGGSDACGASVAPHDGSASATYSYDANAGTLTINGTGAYVGIPKAVNAGELPGVAVPASITYSITLSDNNNTMNVAVESGAGVFWQYKLVRQ